MNVKELTNEQLISHLENYKQIVQTRVVSIEEEKNLSDIALEFVERAEQFPMKENPIWKFLLFLMNNESHIVKQNFDKLNVVRHSVSKIYNNLGKSNESENDVDSKFNEDKFYYYDTPKTFNEGDQINIKYANVVWKNEKYRILRFENNGCVAQIWSNNEWSDVDSNTAVMVMSRCLTETMDKLRMVH